MFRIKNQIIIFRALTRFTFLLMLLSLCTGCKKYEFPLPSYPRVETLPVTEISSDGMTFQAKITCKGEEVINGYGFEWGLKRDYLTVLENDISLPYIDGTDVLSYDLNEGLLNDTLYLVRAFVTTENYLVYGEYVTFRSYGNK